VAGSKPIGILALQGAVEPHAEKFKKLGISTRLVKNSQQLRDISAIVLPGGESSTMVLLLKRFELWEPLRLFAQSKPTWGVCAGSILLAKKVTHPEQSSLALMNFEVSRNAYGRQANSFIDDISPTNHWPTQYLPPNPLQGVFIRAPKITACDQSVSELFYWNEELVMVQQEHLLASTFHPELAESTIFHRYFLDLCERYS